uniref:mitochondrial processing peptidase n=2 Tax=Entomoneis paludosa TaxID=265537 RepID=A0A7S3DMU0_9STRA|mmetsp:Transcript_21528/g.44916  ORF Transcript_21528/g.44916 Transcript_21528/m.44916 type:complete len:470 (+) Transcript_21528:97-1506(+)|eukprot:CAMPEP_0172454078 /NCGR_PEP_ID=MMETSP1065-20121228/11166_1 /TAXON_ID=265537 /ORGANISM="Amphiprora paludosa, Strain CCMP125" /LENGTH=469 /DNA_ID=CAMNT_0013206339 /DNA_START=49 /DNA_END=1458 /DNA_ORIENTATION=+
MAMRVALSKIAGRRTFSTAAAAATSFPDYVLKAPTTDVTTMDSGLRVASETVQGSETATVGVWIDAGSRYETAENNGVAHFLEHLAFKGTEKRTQQQLEVEIENMGGHLNAYTSREQTVYFAKVLKNDVGKAVEILSDVLLNSKLDESAIERERDVILREMSEVNKQQEELVLDHLHATAFQGTGLGRTILGPEENISSLQKSQLVDYIQQHYTAPRMVIAGAGAINHDELCGYASQYFGNLPTASKDGVEIAMEPAVFTGSDYTVKFNSEDTAHVALAYESASWTSEYAFPLMLMQQMLGSYDRTQGIGRNHASKLCQTIAEEELAYSMTTFNTCYKDTGLFGIYFVCPDKKLDHLLWNVMNNLVRLVHTPTDEELERAKLNLKASMLMGLDGHSNVAEDIGRQLLTYGRRMTPAEIFSRIESVTIDDIKATATKVINDQDHALAAVGGIHEMPPYEWIRRRSYWLRY